jgi:hypothetical protein
MADHHIFAELPENKGIWVFKQDDSETDYRKNGHTATLGDPGRCNRYRTPRRILATLKSNNGGKGTDPSPSLAPIGKLSPAHVERYFFEFVAVYVKGKRLGQVIPNFSRGGTPYGNQAHHLIPQTKFLALFPPREEAMLKRVDYNVHNGRNIMFLPAHNTDCSYHNLPFHSGSHTDYDVQVETDAKELSQQLRRLPDPCKEETLKDIKAKLIGLQEKYWNALSNAGPVAVRTVKLDVETE